MDEQTKKIQERIEELKNEENPTLKLICPIMSYRLQYLHDVYCKKEQCALWKSYAERCGLSSMS